MLGTSALVLAMIMSPSDAVSRSDNDPFNASADSETKDLRRISLELPSTTAREEDMIADNPMGDSDNADPNDYYDTTAFLILPKTLEETHATLQQGMTDTPLVDNLPEPSWPSGAIEARPGVTTSEKPAAETTDDVDAIADVEPFEDEDILLPSRKLTSVKVKSGDSLALILSRLGVSSREIHDVVSVNDNTKHLTRLHPGDVLNVDIDESGQLLQLKYELDHERTLNVERQLDQFDTLIIFHDLKVRTQTASGVIDSSLFLSAKNAGLSTNLTMELAKIFGWDIDFALDIRTGDQFTVIYEEIYRDGEKVRDGDIIAAEFINQGKPYRALRYTDADNNTDYYSPEGKTLRSTFLRTPIEFARVSSGFNLQRRHPVLNKIRAHKGVDYAAPRGTPIRAVANGKVVFRGRKGGYGNTVVLQHANKYTTLYAHMSDFKRGVNTGITVKQGDVIGFVGSTGLATGPHLHYEFRIDGIHRNPLTIKLPTASPIRGAYLQDFQRQAQPLLAQLDELRETAVAFSNN